MSSGSPRRRGWGGQWLALCMGLAAAVSHAQTPCSSITYTNIYGQIGNFGLFINQGTTQLYDVNFSIAASNGVYVVDVTKLNLLTGTTYTLNVYTTGATGFGPPFSNYQVTLTPDLAFSDGTQTASGFFRNPTTLQLPFKRIASANCPTPGIDLSELPANWTSLTTMLTDAGNSPTDADGNPVGPPQFVIAAAFGGASLYPAQFILDESPIELKAAYAVLSYNQPLVPGGGQIGTALVQIGTAEPTIGFLSVDVESPNPQPTDNASTDARNNLIYQAVQAVQFAGLKSVLYTNPAYWSNITGNTTSFGCLPLWRAHYDDVAELPFSSDMPAQTAFGGWTESVGKQYREVKNNSATELAASGISAVDLDVFSDLSLFTPGISCASDPQGCMAQDVTSSVGVLRGAFHYNQGAHYFEETVTSINGTGSPITGPISLVFDNLAPSVTVANAALETSCSYPPDSPYLSVSAGNLADGQIVNVPVQFQAGGSGIKYNIRVLSSAGAR